MLKVPPIGPVPSDIMLVGEAPGAREIQLRIPFSGASGDVLNSLLAKAGIDRVRCFITNVCKYRPYENKIEEFIIEKKKNVTPDCVLVNGKYVKPCIVEGLEELKKEIEVCKPKVIIALGRTALWALTGQDKLGSWRGSSMKLLKSYENEEAVVVPTYHPLAILRAPMFGPVAELDLKRAKSLLNPVKREEHFIVTPSLQEVQEWAAFILAEADRAYTPLVCDIETAAGGITCIGFAWNKTHAICIPLMSYARMHYWKQAEEEIIIGILLQILSHSNIRLIGQNFQYDAQFLYKYFGFIPRVYFDTMIGHHVCFPFTPGNSKDAAASPMKKSLSFLASIYCEDYTYWKDELGESAEEFNDEKGWVYNCRDCCYTFEVYEKIQQNIQDMGLEAQNEFQQSLSLPVLRSMLTGIRIDHTKRKALAAEYMGKAEKAQAELDYALGKPLNVNSSPQMIDLFYRQFNFPAQKNRKTKAVSCDEKALERIKSKYPLTAPLIDRIETIRGSLKLCSTYLVDKTSDDKRMHCSFNIAGTETFRFSSSTDAFGSGMNLQNIPSELRKMFTPDPGMEFFDTDLSSADLHLVAWESNCSELKSLLREGKSVYLLLAREYFHDQSISKKLANGDDDPRYKMFKSFCHGSNYLGTPEGLAQNLMLAVPDAIRAQKWYFSRFPEIASWQAEFKERLLDTKEVRNIFGYRIHFFGAIEGNVFNQAIAWLPQSTVACIINRVYVNLDQDVSDVQVLIQCHDSLAGQYPIDRKEEMKKLILENSVITLPYPDPIAIPIGIKTSTTSWGECK